MGYGDTDKARGPACGADISLVGPRQRREKQRRRGSYDDDDESVGPHYTKGRHISCHLSILLRLFAMAGLLSAGPDRGVNASGSDGAPAFSKARCHLTSQRRSWRCVQSPLAKEQNVGVVGHDGRPASRRAGRRGRSHRNRSSPTVRHRIVTTGRAVPVRVEAQGSSHRIL
jgi:hypothetical protein